MLKRQIRRGIFETNSSSTHVITIQKENVLSNPNSAVHTFKYYLDSNDCSSSIYSVSARSFGWEHRTYYDFQDKLMYLLIAIDACCKNTLEKVDVIKGWLSEIHIKVELPEYLREEIESIYIDSKTGKQEKTKYVKSGWYESTIGDGYKWTSYIDHTEDLGEFVDYIFEDKNHFFNFLFGQKSKIETGNDNEETFSWWGTREFKNFDEEWNCYKQWWVKEGEDENQIYEEMKKQALEDRKYHSCPEDVVEFFKGN